MIKDIVNNAFEDYISRCKKRNGEIKDVPKKENFMNIVKFKIKPKTSVSEYLDQFKQLKQVSKMIIPKKPSTLEGNQATRVLELQGQETLVTMMFSIGHAYACAAANVSTICPYYNRLADHGENAGEFLRNMAATYKATAFGTKIMPAGKRNLEDVKYALNNGSNGVIILSELFHELFQHPVNTSFMEGGKLMVAPRSRPNKELCIENMPPSMSSEEQKNKK